MTLHVGVDFQNSGIWRQTIEMSTGILLRTWAVLTRNAFRPVSISFTHEAPATLEVHRRVLGPAIEFSRDINAIVCRNRDLDMPIPAADPGLSREVKRLMDVQFDLSLLGADFGNSSMPIIENYLSAAKEIPTYTSRTPIRPTHLAGTTLESVAKRSGRIHY
ncbi:hypothetical protein CBM2589_U10090 [Cupriavidus taiwanensis]|uniref:HTH-type transcriptional regulator AraC-type N-terminal domain-containing protein n=1 Tax=Cupriavidus taiwanensis TaxID=164546 RepID=A0A375CQA3_9BURK|nr:AraC family transcriptional regulator ligand-binding domain-containing protein [Cupriavidus taiwanensis]SOY77576.1 hypothetical protein CBM2589_U10090 [Cupriavidus taiwanensis]